MGISTSTGTLIAGQSRTFNLSPASAVTLTLSPNVRVTITETPATVAATGLGGNASRVHEPRLPGTFTYGPYPMGGTVVVAVASNSGSSVAWVRSDSIVAESADGAKSLVDGGGNTVDLGGYSGRAPYGLSLVAPPVAGITTNAGAGVTINSAAAATLDGETVWRVSATATAGANNYFELSIPTLGAAAAFSASDMTGEMAFDNMANISSITLYMGTAAYAIATSSPLYNQIVPATTSAWAMNGVMTAYQFHEPLFAANKSGYADETGNQAWVNAKVRIYVNNGTTLVFHLRSLVAGANRKKARLAIIGDDGYDSFQKFGVPIIEEFGFKSSVAVIRENVGTNGFATLAQLQSYVAKGNECIAHGPSDGTGGSGNLWSTYTTNAQRIADINGTRDYLLANGLCSSYGARCYIWPQGRFCESTSDYSMLDVMLANGYGVGRSANQPTVVYFHKLNAISARNRAAFTTPIIGHQWSSAPAEAANIAAIQTRITALGASRTDSTLMLHRIVGVDAAAQSTELASNNLRALLSTIKTEVDAGRMEVVLYSSFVK